MSGYGSDQGFAGWLSENGFELSGDIAEAVLRQRGSAYIDGVYGPKFSGTPTDGFAQERAWPRVGATAYDAAIGDDVIPDAIVQASYFAALYEDQNPSGLSVAATAGQQVKREKVGAIEVEYAGASSGSALEAATPALLAVEGLLAPFLVPANAYGPAIFVI